MSLPKTAFAPMATSLKVLADHANGIATQIKAATSGQDAAVESLIASSDDTDLVNYREWLSKATAEIAKINAAIESNKAAAIEKAKSLVTADTADFDVEAGKKEFLETRQAATATRKALLSALGNDEKALTELLEEYNIVEVVSLRVGGAVKGPTGAKKPRLVSAEVDGTSLTPATFTNLAKSLGVDLDVLKAAAFKAANTDDLMGLPENTTVTFTIPVKRDGKDATANVVIVPKARPVAEKNEKTTEVSEDKVSEDTDSE